MKRFCGLVLVLVFLTGCPKVERSAYNTVVGSKAFLDSIKAKHPECATGATSTVCVYLKKATSAKDLLIDVGEAYCSGTSFDQGLACSPPIKGTPGYDIAIGKLKAALAGYQQAETDLRGVL